MNLSFSFFVLYILSSLTLIAVQIWLFFIVYSPAGSLISHLICRAGNAIAIFVQLCLVVKGEFPFRILSSQIRYIDDLVRMLALVFVVLHGVVYVFLIYGGLPKPRREWRD
ncbi:hypothetical protein SB6411_03700 [Klebsiella spallanzanii]|uniref:Uncharacterized protein n=1 Tax=Klebsiella spallanzanii TaxID=2587528 RepID=A0ABY6VKH9_9ENTR|nr:hypothetical protein [Klebsiella spallanzanii]VUS93874.1 hypothetical protein SB6411_03700 [Klebsiella spallanzanii]